MRSMGVVATAVLCFSVAAFGDAPSGFNADYQRVASRSIVQDKNFYLLTLLQYSSRGRAELAADAELAAIAKQMTDAHGASSFSGDLKAVALAAAHSMIFSDDEIAKVRAQLLTQTERSTALQALVNEHLRPSGAYQRLSSKSDAEMLAEAWVEAAHGINHIVEQFVLNKTMRYGDIDSPSYSIDTALYQKLILKAREDAATKERVGGGVLFFEPALDFALYLLAINRRDEAGRHEPMELGENAAAMERMRSMTAKEWKTYPYASLLVHSIGDAVPGMAISEGSRQNAAAAAALYAKKRAPFIIASGGYVHPKQTIFSEAIEIKRELMMVYGIPENAILIDPHARHTTTNVRNAARLLFQGHAPADKPSVSVSNKRHIDDIVSQKFIERCQREIGHQPAKYGKRISDEAAEFIPSVDALHIDPSDPLDP